MSSLEQKLLLLLISLLFIAGTGNFQSAKGQDLTSSPSFNINMQLQVYSIDLRTEIAHSSSYYFRMWTYYPEVKSFEVVILRPDYQESLRIISWNESGHQQVYEEIKTDPSEVSVPWQWHMNPKRPYGLGTPFDYYEISFLIAINMSTKLDLNET